MPEYTIRNIKLEELKEIYNRIEQDFARGEYAPYNKLYQQLQEGIQTGVILMEGDRDVAYSISAVGAIHKYVLISLIAVYKEYRGRGFGTAFLEILKNIYSDQKGIIVEVEIPELAKTHQEKIIREKRIQFYQNLGFDLVREIQYVIWDVPMHLMVLQQSPNEFANGEIKKAMYEIYLKLLGEQFIHKMIFESLH